MRGYMLMGITLMIAALALAACGGGGTSSTARIDPPVVKSVEPASGGIAGGDTVFIRGVRFKNVEIGTTVVMFGDTPASKVVVESDTQIKCEAPARDAGPCTVSVTKNHGTGELPNGYTYYPAPTIASVTPDSGSKDGGLVVTIKGTGFQDNDAGEAVVTFATIPSPNVTVLDDTTLEALTPEVIFEKAVELAVSNRNGMAALPGGFVFKGPLPIISSVTPDTGSTNGNEEVTVIGNYFTIAGGDMEVIFNGIKSAIVTRVSDTELTCRTPMSSVEGPVDVLVANSNGTSQTKTIYTYVAPPMSVNAISPTEGKSGEAIAVTITGVGFLFFNAGTPTVTLGGDDLTSIVVVSDTTITGETPLLDAGFHDLVVTNNRGTATLPSAFKALWTPKWQTSFGNVGPSGDEGQSKLSLPFTFEFCGVDYDDVYPKTNGFVNFNGYYTGGSYTANFSSNPQINICGADLHVDSPGVLYYNSSSDLYWITYSQVSWWYQSGSITCQIQLRSDGTWAMLWKAITWGGTMSVGFCPASPYSTDSVTWSSSPSVADGDAASESYTSSMPFIGKALIFEPDGEGGYTTRSEDYE